MRSFSSLTLHPSSLLAPWQKALLLIAIVLLGGSFRFLNLYGWDGLNSGNGLHPDERFIVYTVYGMRVPRSFGDYLRSSCLNNGQMVKPRNGIDASGGSVDPSTYEPSIDSGCNTLNPRNYNWSRMFVYGSLPTTLTRVLTELRYGDHPERVSAIQVRDVGRTQSMLFDIGSILLVFLIGRRLYGTNAGLLASFLYACAALPIQLAHFFTVDSATGFFTLLTIYWAVRIARGGGIFAFVMLGVSVGGAMACRITMATLGMTGVVAIVQRVWEQRQLEQREPGSRSGFAVPWAMLLKMGALLIVSGLFAVLTFRLLAPDTFVGTSFFDLRPEPRFLDNIMQASGFVNGSIDAPFSQQWASRTPFLFPLTNMVVWGMGLPLGIAAWLAWAAAGWQIVRRRMLRHLIPVIWIGFYFAWQGGQFGMTMRYYALLYGLLAVLAAWAVLAFGEWISAHPFFGPHSLAPAPIAIGEEEQHSDAGESPLAPAPIAIGEEEQHSDAGKSSPPTALPPRNHLASWLGWLPLLMVALGSLLWGVAFTAIYRQPHTRIAASNWIYANIPSSATISSEIWDDGLPLNGEDFPSVQYRSLQMFPYAEDEQAKYTGYLAADGTTTEGLLDQLEQIDYLILSSNRIYDSTKRLPMRYPAVMRYYHYLFTGELGFELAADFHSYPTLFGLSFPDQGAEEAFSVYDHPRVLIFKKTAAFSRDKAERLLTSDVAFGEIYKIPTVDVKKVPTALRLTDQQWPWYRAGGTWTELFHSQQLPWLVWLLALELIGLAAFALLFPVLAMLPDRGFALSKILGLLLVSYLAWLLASWHVLSFAPRTVWLCVALLLIAGLLSARLSRAALLTFVRRRWPMLLIAEALFLLSYAGMLVVRSLNPDLWMAAGKNHLADLATLTAVAKSAAFPPYDPWFAGGYLNTPYFGFVQLGVLMQMTGIVPTIAYNLGIATMFALAMLGAWGLGYNLRGSRVFSRKVAERGSSRPQPQAQEQPATASPRRVTSRSRDWSAAVSGLIAAACVMLAGPLGSTFALSYAFGFALFGLLGGASMTFPLYMALLGLLVAVLRANLAIHKNATKVGILAFWRSTSFLTLALLALTLGALGATGRWDATPMLIVVALTLLIAVLARRKRQSLWLALVQIGLIWLLSMLFFLPFTRSYASELGKITFSLDQRSTTQEMLASIGVWLFLLISAMVLVYRRARRMDARWILIIVLLVGLGLGFFALRNMTAFNPLVLLFFVGMLLLGDLLLRPLAGSLPEERTEASPLTIALMAWPLLAIALLMATQFLAFKGTSNPVSDPISFLQVCGPLCWSLLALSAGLALPWLWKELGQSIGTLSWAWRIPALLISLATLSALVLGMPDHVAGRSLPQAGLSLDGGASLRQGSWMVNDKEILLQEDTALIEWMQNNITGTPLILEGNQDSNPWSGRVAALTGLPTPIAQPAFAKENRAMAYAQPVIDYRRDLVSWIYSSGHSSEVLRHLKLYGIEYVYVGELERALYPEAGLQLFDQLVDSKAIFLEHSVGNARLYRIPKDGTLPAVLTTTLPVVAPQGSGTANPAAMLHGRVGGLPDVGLLGTLGNGGTMAQIGTVLLWLLLGYGAMLLGLPVAALSFAHSGRWSDSGYAWARLIGLLLLGYAVWLPVSAGWWYNDWRGVMLGLGVVLLLNLLLLAGIGYRSRSGSAGPLGWLVAGLRSLGRSVRQHAGRILQVEVLFLLSFGFMLLLRAMNPDLWQPYWGGEKPFEFGLLNAVLRSPVMPPYSPFFSDGTINYYYYGLFLVSLPIKLAGIAPALGFNLVIATLYGLFCCALFALGARISGRAWVGLAAVVLVALFGNLAAFFAAGWSGGIGPALSELNKGPAGFGMRLGSWFVGPSRVIPNTINEFPFWGFLFADLHPHLIAMPITLLVVGLAYSLLQGGERSDNSTASRMIICALLALALGTLAVTNSWDLPSYGLLLAGVLMVEGWRVSGGGLRRLLMMLRGAMTALGIMLLGLLLFLPFFLHFKSPVGGLGLVTTPTKLRDYLLIYGIFLAILLPSLIAASWRLLKLRLYRTTLLRSQGLGIVAGPAAIIQLPSLLLLGLTVLLLAGIMLALIAPIFASGSTPSAGLAGFAEQMQALLGPRIWALALLLCSLPVLLSRRVSLTTWFATWLAVVGLAVSCGIEIVYLRDHLKGGEWYRMNTVFKFGVQIWILLGLAAALCLPRLIRGLSRRSLLLSVPAGLLLLIMALLGLVYPLVGIPSRVADRFPERPGMTLDGLAFLDKAVYTVTPSFLGLPDGAFEPIPVALGYDGEAIRWLNEHISGTPVVLQSSAEFYRLYGVRIAANTGLPTVVSPLHEAEQRDPALVWAREADVQQIYKTTSGDEALRLMANYQVAYVVVGPIERIVYGKPGCDKFEAMSLQGAGLQPTLTVAYQNEQVTIYQVDQSVYQRFATNIQQSPVTGPAPEPETSAADIIALEQLLKADPTNADLIWKLTQAYANAGRPEDAVKVLEPLVREKPDDVLLQHFYGDLLADSGRYTEAEDAYRRAVKIDPSAGNLVKLAVGLLRFGKLDAAEAALAEASSIDPNLASAQCVLGSLNEQRGRVEQARGFYQRCLELSHPGEATLQDATNALQRLEK